MLLLRSRIGYDAGASQTKQPVPGKEVIVMINNDLLLQVSKDLFVETWRLMSPSERDAVKKSLSDKNPKFSEIDAVAKKFPEFYISVKSQLAS